MSDRDAGHLRGRVGPSALSPTPGLGMNRPGRVGDAANGAARSHAPSLHCLNRELPVAGDLLTAPSPPLDSMFSHLACDSHRRLTGVALVPEEVARADISRWLYEEAPFALLVHDASDDPVFVSPVRGFRRARHPRRTPRLLGDAPVRGHLRRIAALTAPQAHTANRVREPALFVEELSIGARQ